MPATKVAHRKQGRAQFVAFTSGAAMSLLVIAAILLGSGWLERFDAPLAAYAAATVLAAFGIGYRYAMWVQRPPTWKYFKASWKLFFRLNRLIPNLALFARMFFDNIVAQRFIERRGRGRWLAHLCLAWGCLAAFGITFPLSWGWVQFGAEGNRYSVEFMGLRQFSFDPNSIVGFFMLNGLNISAVLILVGIGLAMHRRLYDRGAQAVQNLANDLIPLFLLFAVSVTGLMLTASYKLMGGEHFSFLSLLHAFTVVVFLLYLPFGKLFHVIQRPAQIGVQFYKEEGARGAQAVCPRSGEPFQSRLHRDDLGEVMAEIGLDFGGHQDLSPTSKRKLIALNQAALLGDQPYVG